MSRSPTASTSSRCCARSPSRTTPTCWRSAWAPCGWSRSTPTCRRTRSRCRACPRTWPSALGRRSHAERTRRRPQRRADERACAADPLRPRRRPGAAAGARRARAAADRRRRRAARLGLPRGLDLSAHRGRGDRRRCRPHPGPRAGRRGARRCSTASTRAAIADLAALFAEREPQGRAVTDVAQAARAATFGAVDTLIVDMDAVVAGHRRRRDRRRHLRRAAARPRPTASSTRSRAARCSPGAASSRRAAPTCRAAATSRRCCATAV